jgi:transposase
MKAMNVISVGCDSHEKTLVNLIAVNRESAEQCKLSNTRRGRQKLIALLQQKAQELGGARIVLAYEASSQGFILYDELKAAGVECYVLAPTKIERSHQQKLNKNDRKDGKRLLDIIRSHVLAGTELPAVWVPDAQTRDDRETVRTRHDLAEKQTVIKTQIQMLLKRWGIEKPSQVRGSRTKSYRQWLLALSQDGARAIGFRTALSSLIRQLEFQELELQHMDESINDLCEKPHLKPVVEALDAECGVGRLAAVTYATEVGDFCRFRRRQQIAAYWGVTPSSDESGEIQDRKGHITRHGSPRVRRILCQSHWVGIKHDAHEREVYQRLIAKNPKRKKIAVVAGMRRLSIRLWHVGRQAQLRLKGFASK